MLIQIQNFEPVQLVFTPFYDATLLSMVSGVNLHTGKKNYLYGGLQVIEGEFIGQHFYLRTKATSALACEFFRAVGIETANGVNIESSIIEGRRLLVDVIRQNPSMMYKKVVGFRPVKNSN